LATTSAPPSAAAVRSSQAWLLLMSPSSIAWLGDGVGGAAAGDGVGGAAAGVASSNSGGADRGTTAAVTDSDGVAGSTADAGSGVPGAPVSVTVVSFAFGVVDGAATSVLAARNAADAVAFPASRRCIQLET
jgi:hypothetical protein